MLPRLQLRCPNSLFSHLFRCSHLQFDGVRKCVHAPAADDKAGAKAELHWKTHDRTPNEISKFP